MVKKVGSIDKVRYRKTRSDRGKKRTHYKGKPCKHRSARFYRRTKKGNKTDFWMHPWLRKPMSRDGYLNVRKDLRPKWYKEVTDWKSVKPRRVPFSEINTKQKMEEYIAKNCWEGKWIIMGGSHAKNKGHFKPVPICIIVVKKTPNGNVGNMIQSIRLHKYKHFYKG